MKSNVGNIDRVIRIVVGLAIVAGAATGAIGMWGWIGVLPIATATLGVCPAYLPLGINTCKTRKN